MVTYENDAARYAQVSGTGDHCLAILMLVRDVSGDGKTQEYKRHRGYRNDYAGDENAPADNFVCAGPNLRLAYNFRVTNFDSTRVLVAPQGEAFVVNGNQLPNDRAVRRQSNFYDMAVRAIHLIF